MSTFCSACGTSIEGDDRFCRVCGAPAVANPSAGVAPPVPVLPTRTSSKAVLSLIFGLFIFFPLSVVAIILGHLSLSEIRKSAGTVTGEGLAIAGMVLGYVGVAAVPFILIIAAIAIPNLLRARMAANESSAVTSVRTIYTAQMTYAESHREAGYACTLSALSDAQIIDSGLGQGQKTGYRFEIRNCAPELAGGPNQKYQVVAYPLTANQTGMRAFCMDESGVIKMHSTGSPQRCLDDGVPLQ